MDFFGGPESVLGVCVYLLYCCAVAPGRCELSFRLSHRSSRNSSSGSKRRWRRRRAVYLSVDRECYFDCSIVLLCCTPAHSNPRTATHPYAAVGAASTHDSDSGKKAASLVYVSWNRSLGRGVASDIIFE